ncbi:MULTISPECIES: four-helix bundle copper-binding protein [Mycobacterium]|nr:MULTISPECIES: four-helix bundle copper-binding protein [Mycobacterium]
MADCVRLCLDCAAICAACVTLVSRGSRWAAQLCQLCAEICDACAAEGDKHDNDHHYFGRATSKRTYAPQRGMIRHPYGPGLKARGSPLGALSSQQLPAFD